MSKEEVAPTEPQKAPYVRPAIVTLKVDLSFASSATELGKLLDRGDLSQDPGPAETRQSKAATGVKKQS